MRNLTLFVFVATLASACATTPMPVSEAKETPRERVYFQTRADGPFATAIFVRDTGFTGGGVYQHLTINGEEGAAIDAGEKVTLQLPAGEYSFGVKPTDPFGSSAPYAIDQKLEAGKSYYYRILTDGNTLSTRIQRTIGKFTE